MCGKTKIFMVLSKYVEKKCVLKNKRQRKSLTNLRISISGIQQKFDLKKRSINFLINMIEQRNSKQNLLYQN